MTTFEDVNVDELQDISPEEVEARDVFTADNIDTVDNPLLDFFLGAGQSAGGRQRSQAIREGRLASNDPTVTDGKLYGQDFQQIKEECFESGELFLDREFPPDDATLYYSKQYSGFEWKRPFEITENPELFVDGADRFDINQVDSK